ncbi:MAG: hypothetical protein DIU62_004885 [Pseudomonadota bacterium]
MNAGIAVPAGLMLTCCAVIAGAAGKNPRDAKMDVTYMAAQPITDPLLIGEWLARFAGRYRVEGVIPRVEPDPIHGAIDCQLVGPGPGLHCIYSVSWLERLPTRADSGIYDVNSVPWLDPAMMLLGIDPAARGLSYLLVNHKGLPDGGSGFIAGERATFRARCANPREILEKIRIPVNGRPPATCERITRIDLRPGERIVKHGGGSRGQ